MLERILNRLAHRPLVYLAFSYVVVRTTATLYLGLRWITRRRPSP